MSKQRLVSHPLHWIVDEIVDHPSYLERSMFGCRACYIHGRMQLVLAAQGEEPWSGVLVPTVRDHHRELITELPLLVEHPVLGKWLYLSQHQDGFEESVTKLVQLIEQNDTRIGVLPGKTRKRSKAVKKKIASRKNKPRKRSIKAGVGSRTRSGR